MNREIPKGWRETTLGEVITDIAMGPFGSNLKVSSFVDEGVPVIKGRNLLEYYVSGKFSYVSEEKADSLNRSVAFPGDIIVTHRGTLGQVSLVPFDKYPRYVASQSQLRFTVNTNEIDREYLVYFLRSRIGQYELLKNSSQVGVPAIASPTKSMKEIDLIIPKLKEQVAIREILKSLDKKIELLEEENKTLEKLAQTIFTEWFVNFNYPEADGEMGEIPKGWRVGKLKEVGEIICGKTPSKKNDGYFNGIIPFIKIPDLHNQMYIIKTSDSLTEKGANSQKLKTIPENSLVVSCIATVGLVGITTKSSQTNQQINSIIPMKEYLLEYLYYLIKNKKAYLNDIGRGGTATLNVNKTVFSNIDIIIPKELVLEKFSEIIRVQFKKIKKNSEQIETLKSTRETLLPKLTTGEIRVEGYGE